MQVAKLNAKADRQHVRRALSDDELVRLIATAQTGSAWSWSQGNGTKGTDYCLEMLTITGPDRAMLSAWLRKPACGPVTAAPSHRPTSTLWDCPRLELTAVQLSA